MARSIVRMSVSGSSEKTLAVVGATSVKIQDAIQHSLDFGTGSGQVDRVIPLEQTLAHSAAGTTWAMNTLVDVFGATKAITKLKEVYISNSSSSEVPVTVSGTLLATLFGGGTPSVVLAPGDFLSVSSNSVGFTTTTQTLLVTAGVGSDSETANYKIVLMGT